MTGKHRRPRDANQLAKFIADIACGNVDENSLPKSKSAVKNGAKGGEVGGKARAKSLTSKRRTEIAVNAARSRWGNQTE